VLVAGGRAASPSDSGSTSPFEAEGQTLRSTEIYDPEADTWTTTGDLLVPRKDGHVLTLRDGTALVLGGDDDYNTQGDVPWCPTPLTSVERFDLGS
jgi:hypothetical protein